MIIFDLDMTLADCSHRRHFVDPMKAGYEWTCHDPLKGENLKENWGWWKDGQKFKPDWPAFYEASDQDTLMVPVANIYERLWRENDYYDDFEIWSGRCESVREKTEKWLDENGIRYSALKMRPIGDCTPDDVLKERWLDEAIAEGKTIDFVFDDRPKVVRFWRRRGIFVFDCNQDGREF